MSRHVWAKAPKGWVCTKDVHGAECRKVAVVVCTSRSCKAACGCPENHACSGWTGRCSTHAPRKTKPKPPRGVK